MEPKIFRYALGGHLHWDAAYIRNYTVIPFTVFQSDSCSRHNAFPSTDRWGWG